MGTSALRRQMGIIDSRMLRDRSRRTSILEGVLEDQLLELLWVEGVVVVLEDVIMNGASGALQCNMGVEIPVELIRMSASSLDQSARERIAVLINLAARTSREESNVMAFGGNDHSEVGLGLGDRFAQNLHVVHFLIKNMLVLALRDAIAEVKDALRESTVAGAIDPALEHGAEKVLDVLRSDDLNTVAVCLAHSRVLSVIGIHRARNSAHGAAIAARRGVGDVGSNDHGRDCLIVLDRNPLKDIADSAAGRAAELGVDLHADVRDVLRLALQDMIALNHLRGNAVAALASLLDFLVDIGQGLLRKDEEDELRLHLELVAGVVPSVLNHVTARLWIAQENGRLRAGNDTAMALVDLDELVAESLSCRLVDLVVAELGMLHNAEAPRLERLLVDSEEALAVDAPTAPNSL